MAVPKGKGKGPAPPATPRAVAAPKGKGKGKGPALPHTKGTGKGAPTPPLTPVPRDLIAPRHAQLLRVDRAAFRGEGTIWDGLEPFGVAGVFGNDGPLEGTEIDVDLLRTFWAPQQVAAPVAAPEPRVMLNHSHLQRMQIAMQANALSPDLVRRALTEDLDLLSIDQATALAKDICPFAAEAAASISAEVARRGGAADLNLSEAMIWTIINIPKGEQRAQVLAERSQLQGELEYVQERLEKAEGLVLRLRDSRPLKSILQIALAVRNIMSQRSSEGMRCERLTALFFEKVGALGYQNGVPPTSVIEVIVQMVEAAHARRARLRFHRMMAVGQLAPDDNAKRIVWSFLGDQQASPWDSLSLLADCDSDLFSSEMVSEIRSRGHHMRRILHDQFPAALAAAAVDSRTTESWRRQFDGAMRRVREVADFFDQSLVRLTAAATSLNKLFGESASGVSNPSRQLLEERAAACLCSHLKSLGKNLTTERLRQKTERERSADISQLGGSGGRRARIWPRVDTTAVTLHATSDTDLLRSLGFLLPSRGAAGAHDGPEGVYRRNPETGEWVTQRSGAPALSGPSGADLLHGGADGVFVRDSVTGRWVSSYTGRAHDGPEGIDRSAYQRNSETGEWVMIYA